MNLHVKVQSALRQRYLFIFSFAVPFAFTECRSACEVTTEAERKTAVKTPVEPTCCGSSHITVTEPPTSSTFGDHVVARWVLSSGGFLSVKNAKGTSVEKPKCDFLRRSSGAARKAI